MQVDLVYAERRSDNSTANSPEDLITLQHALNELSEQHREIILLRFAEDMRFNEIAALQGRGLEATKSLFRRAMSALQKVLDVKNERNSKK
jgi:DNA-directed RNA polymerase specialized sigma24 family protein